MTRVEVIGGPWPKRVGCRGVIVDQLRPEYPWVGLRAGEAVILLDDDPIKVADMFGPTATDWSCVIERDHLAALTTCPNCGEIPARELHGQIDPSVYDGILIWSHGCGASWPRFTDGPRHAAAVRIIQAANT